MYKFLLALVVATFAVSVPVAQATDSAMPGAGAPEVHANGHSKQHHHGKQHHNKPAKKAKKDKMPEGTGSMKSSPTTPTAE